VKIHHAMTNSRVVLLGDSLQMSEGDILT